MPDDVPDPDELPGVASLRARASAALTLAGIAAAWIIGVAADLIR